MGCYIRLGLIELLAQSSFSFTRNVNQSNKSIKFQSNDSKWSETIEIGLKIERFLFDDKRSISCIMIDIDRLQTSRMNDIMNDIDENDPIEQVELQLQWSCEIDVKEQKNDWNRLISRLFFIAFSRECSVVSYQSNERIEISYIIRLLSWYQHKWARRSIKWSNSNRTSNPNLNHRRHHCIYDATLY